MSISPELEAVEKWIVQLIRTTGLRADPFSLYGYTHGAHKSPHGIVMELSDGSSYKLALTQLMRPALVCSVCGGTPIKARGLCSVHYQRIKKSRPLEAGEKTTYAPRCQQDGCRKQAILRGYCKPHYEYHRKRGEFRDRD